MVNKYWGTHGDLYGVVAEFTRVARLVGYDDPPICLTNWIYLGSIMAFEELPGTEYGWIWMGWNPWVPGTHFPYGYAVVPYE